MLKIDFDLASFSVKIYTHNINKNSNQTSFADWVSIEQKFILI